MWCCKRQVYKWEDQYAVKVEATVAAHIRKKRWEIDNLMELPADELPSVDGTVLDPLPTKVNINTNEQIKKTNKIQWYFIDEYKFNRTCSMSLIS